MNKNILTILTTAAMVIATGCATAGTWVNGCYIDGPLCTVCDGMKVINHAYGATICTHCDGTGIEPPEVTTIVENTVVLDTVVCDTWCPPPPPPRWHHPRPAPPPRHNAAPRPKAAPRHNAAPRPKAAPRHNAAPRHRAKEK